MQSSYSIRHILMRRDVRVVSVCLDGLYSPVSAKADNVLFLPRVVVDGSGWRGHAIPGKHAVLKGSTPLQAKHFQRNGALSKSVTP